MPLPPIPVDRFRQWATDQWTAATQALVDAIPVDNWALDAQQELTDAFTQAQQWLTPPPPPPAPEPLDLGLEVMGPPSPDLGQRARMETHTALGGVGDWASQAQAQIGGLASDLGSGLRGGFDAFGAGLTGTPDRLTPPAPQDDTQAFLQRSTLAPGVDTTTPSGVTGAALVAPPPGVQGLGDLLGAARDTAGALADPGMWLRAGLGVSPMGPAVEAALGSTPYEFQQGLTDRLGPVGRQGPGATKAELEARLGASPLGQWYDQREAEERTQQRIEDEQMARMAFGALPGQGGRPADVDPDEWERKVARARWLRETGQNIAGAGGLKTPSAAQLNEVLASAPLASPTSLAANATSGLVRTLERLAYKVGEGRPLEALSDVTAMARELGNGELWRRMARSFESGPTPRNPGVTGVQVEGALSNAPGLRAKALTAGVRANAATDELVRSLNEAGARAAGARRGLTGEALEAFVREAGDFATVTGPNSPIASALNKAKGWVGDPEATALQKTLGWFASGVAPYVGMPERLLVSTLSSTTAPVTAPLNALWRAARGKPVDPRALASRMAVGGLLDLWLAHLAAEGGVYGPPPQDRAERERMEREGAVWDSLVVGDKAVPLRYFGTIGSQASLVADVYRAQQRAVEQGKPFGGAKQATDEFLRWTLNDSYLSDATRFFSDVAAGRGTDALARLAGSVPGRVTSIVSGPVNASDPYERDTRGIAGSLARAVPGGRYALPAEIDPATGERMRRRGSGLSRYLGVTPGTEESPESAELATRGVGVRAFADGKYAGVAQTPDALERVKRAYGSEVGKETRATLASREYQEARPLEKHRLLQQALARAYAEADVRLGDTVTRAPRAQAAFEYRAVPQYEGVKGTPEEVRRQNARIADAKRQVTAARAKYPGDPDKGERELIQRSRETVRLAERARVPSEELRRARTAIYAKYGLNPQGQDEEALDEEAGG